MADVVVDYDNKNSKELYAQGVRAYILQDYSSAVAALGKASEILVAEHGSDLHESLGEVYLYYGKSLLELSREENEALGDAVPRNNESSGDEEEQEVVDNAEGTENADNEANEIKDEPIEVTNNGDASAEQKDQGTTEKTSNSTGNEPSSSNGTATAEEAEEEPTDLQVAWEVLELAKKIFQNKGASAKKHLAEVLTVLGEVSLESENFTSAIDDINDGLNIQKTIFAKDSRTVAETYYKLGVAYSTNSQIDEAVNSFKGSLEYLKNRIDNLEKLEDKNDEILDEIKEINQLIPDIQEKISDMGTYKNEALRKIISVVTEGTKLENSTPSTSSSKPASDISHLVKRKRKADESEEIKSQIDSNPPKKPNTE